ncbi:MAG: TIGR03936 family radical SAM-associated protein [Acidimicrobiales bacterium]|nr:TIGR03936 family radical SAM-associated protein [Acidimicrobiales bacterium]
MRQRLRFTKQGKIRFLSHRDLARIWERTLRRAGVAVAYSEGFSPRPRLHFGLALSTGHESLGEYLDIDLAPDGALDPADLPALVNPHLPEGMTAQAVIPVEAGSDSLQQAVTSCGWEIEVVGAGAPAVAAAAQRALGASALPTTVERKGASVSIDARPAILALEVAPSPVPTPVPTPDGVAPLRPSTLLVAELATQPRSLRPAELVRALDPAWVEGRVLRTHQWTLVDGARCEPIPLSEGGARGATSIPHAGARAS